MVQPLQLGSAPQSVDRTGMSRLNRLPIVVGIVIVILFLAVLIYGLSSRGLKMGQRGDLQSTSNSPAITFADQLKRGVKDGIIGDPAAQQVYQPTPVIHEQRKPEPDKRTLQEPSDGDRRSRMEPESEWRARLDREQQEQILREQQRQLLASVQARGAANDSPLKIDLSELDTNTMSPPPANRSATSTLPTGNSDLFAAALKAGLGGQTVDPNGQPLKEAFFNADLKQLGYLPSKVMPQRNRHELKRGSIIPATMITGLNSDLPGRISAQVSQNVYDSATGHYLLIPQGAKLFGRYDSKVSFGQSRALVVWTDIIFPNGSTLQIGGMTGTDAEGYGGFKDKVNRHLLRTFGSAALIALIGTGIDMVVPQGSTLATQDTASDAGRRNFAETFGRVAEQTISKNLNVQPTIRIRPGYIFNILVDQDIIFPSPYRDR